MRDALRVSEHIQHIIWRELVIMFAGANIDALCKVAKDFMIFYVQSGITATVLVLSGTTQSSSAAVLSP